MGRPIRPNRLSRKSRPSLFFKKLKLNLLENKPGLGSTFDRLGRRLQ